MILKKIVIKNIRCHKYLEFEPEINGTTSICGENGAGKSTIVDSLSWALFGTRLHGLKNNSYIRDGVDPKNEEVSVSVYMYVGNREYKIKREIKNLNGNSECNVYSRKINTEEEYEFESGPTITFAEEFIRKILGMNEKGYFASTFIQQKQVDQIVSSTPKERGEVIEQLLGISSIAEAISMSREHIRDLQKSAGVIQYKPQKEELEKLNSLKSEAENLSKKLDEEKRLFKEKHKELLELEKQFKESTKRRESIEKLEQDEQSLKNEISILQNSLKDKLNLISKLGTSNDCFDFKSIEKKYKEIYDKNLKITSDISINKSKLKELDKLYSINIDKNTPIEYKEKQDEAKEVIKSINDLLIKKSIVLNEINDNNTFLSKLEEGITQCPFCGEEIKDVDKEKDKHSELVKKLEKKLKTINNNLNNEEERKVIIEKRLEELKEVALIKKEQNDKLKEYNQVKKDIEDLSNQVLSIATELKVITEEYDKSKVAKSNTENLAQLKKDVKEINKALQVKSKALDKIVEEKNKVGIITASEYRDILKDFNAKKDKYTSNKIELVEKNGELKLIKEKGREALESYKRNEELIKKYNELMQELEILNATNDSLVSFKENRINASIPALTNIASELYNKFTEGEFIEMKLDADFKATVVTKDGVERPIAQLSGGELSAAAIALRLAIAIFLHDNKQSLLILDEVLVSMSEGRSQIILESIASMNQTQIIFIAHSNIANSFADKIVNIEATDI